MTIKKIGVFIGTVGLVTALVIGCGSSSTNYTENNNTDNNSTEIGLEAGSFTGATFNFILNGLANGVLSTVTGDVMGELFSLLGWGNSGSNEEEQTLKNISKTLTVISGELNTIESTILEILKAINILKHEIYGDVNWPRDAVNYINTAHGDLNSTAYYDVNGTIYRYKPGEGNQTLIKKHSNVFLYGSYAIEEKVQSISDAIAGNDIPLLSNYVDLVIDELDYNDGRLQQQYQGFETYTTELLSYQIMGVNEVIEAKKVLEGNSSAELYFDGTFKPMLAEEVDNIDNPTSFIYNAVSLVLRNAPLYEQFLPTSAESILKQAEFYRLLVTGTDDKKFGLRLFHISTMDRPVAPDHLYASKDGSSFHNCDASRHVVKGRPYDQWDGNSVDSNTAYRVVEYACGSVTIGTYSIYPVESSASNVLTTAEVANYDVNYTKTDDGNITYGLGVMHDYVNNHFIESWDHWSQQKHADENVHIFGSANHWPIGIEIDFQNNNSDFYGSTELDGHFTYSGSEDKQITIDYHAEIYLKASAEKVYLGSKPYAKAGYKTGVWNSTNSDSECSSEHTLTAGSGHSYSEHDYPKHSCNFTAKPGHHYYVYFKMFNKGDETDDWDVTAISKLEKVYRVYVKFSE